MPTADKQLALTLLIIVFALIAILLVAVLVGSTIRQQRRYLRTREHLGGRLLTAQDEERAAIARELHDDVVQKIAKAAMLVRQGQAGDIAGTLDRIGNDLRSLARGMHPTLVDHLGLDAALRDLAVAIGKRDGVVVEYTGTEGTDALTPPQRLAFYRVAQEALGNVAHHAGVRTAQMQFVRDQSGVRLIVADQGKGFSSRAAAAGPGLGVTSMTERLEILGGSLSVEAAPGQGTRVTAILPLEAGTR